MLKNLLLSLLSVVLVANSAMPVMAYQYTMPTNPLYKYSTPSSQYKYTTPSSPYKFTTPTAPYKFTTPTNPYKYSSYDNPLYKYTHPQNPLYKYTTPGVIYEDTDDPQDYDCTDNPFLDIQGHPAEGYIIDLYCMGLLQGYSDGTFRPENTITRAEILKIAMMSSGVEPHEGSHELGIYFVDLGDWQAPWVNTAFELGIVDGYDGGDGYTYYYAPNNAVNRVEGVKLMLATFGIHPGEITESSFIDVSGWMVPWVEVAYGIGVVDMTDTGKFYPASSLTRADAATYLHRLMSALQ